MTVEDNQAFRLLQLDWTTCCWTTCCSGLRLTGHMELQKFNWFSCVYGKKRLPSDRHLFAKKVLFHKNWTPSILNMLCRDVISLHVFQPCKIFKVPDFPMSWPWVFKGSEFSLRCIAEEASLPTDFIGNSNNTHGFHVLCISLSDKRMVHPLLHVLFCEVCHLCSNCYFKIMGRCVQWVVFLRCWDENSFQIEKSFWSDQDPTLS